MNYLIKSTFYSFLFLLSFSPTLEAQTNCKNCSVTNCSSVSVSFTYGGQTFNYDNVPWVGGMNVRVAMLSAQTQNGFSFTTTNYCPYGGFLVSFNNIYPGSGYYWELKINDTPASFGMDFQQLNAGDAVSWVMTKQNTSIKKANKSHQHKMVALHMKNVIGD